MVRVRLKRTGTRNAVCFRVVVMDQRSSRDGKAIEELGFYNPRTKEESVNVERADYWKSVGAVFSPTVVDVIERVRAGKTLRDVERPAAPSKKAVERAKAEAEAKAAAEAEEAVVAEEKPAEKKTAAKKTAAKKTAAKKPAAKKSTAKKTTGKKTGGTGE